MASGRTLSACRLYRHQHGPPAERVVAFYDSAEHASNGSRKARARSNGRRCHIERSPRTPSVSSFMRWPTISAISSHFGDAGADQGLVADKLKEKLIKIGAKVVSHRRYVAFQMAKVAIHGIYSPTFCGSSRNSTAASHINRVKRSFVTRPSQTTGEVRLNDGKFGNFQRSAWRRLVPSPSTARANGAELPKTRNRANSERPGSYLVNVG